MCAWVGGWIGVGGGGGGGGGGWMGGGDLRPPTCSSVICKSYEL